MKESFMFFVLFLSFFFPQKGLSRNGIAVSLEWNYSKFEGPIESWTVSKAKSKFISETNVVETWSEVPKLEKISYPIFMKKDSSYSFLIAYENKSKVTKYFFAVPHEIHPHVASAGHYFECLCVNKLYKVRPGKIWYRIVRINLNSNFGTSKEFSLVHQIVGVEEKEAESKYKDKIYE